MSDAEKSFCGGGCGSGWQSRIESLQVLLTFDLGLGLGL